MKKFKKILILGAFLLLLIPLFYARAEVFKPATLFKGLDRVSVYSKSQADFYFKSGYKLEIKEIKLGVAIPLAVANFETSLAAALSATATSSMTLVNGTTDDGTTLNGTYGFVLNSGSANQEYILANCVNTTCASLVRGISVVTGNTSISALENYHLRGASVKITDHPILITLARILSGFETTPGGLTFRTNAITGLNTPNSASSTAAANVDYVNTSVTSGAPVASETSKGISELATQAEMAAGTATGTTAANLILQSKYAKASSTATTTIPITNTSGKIDSGFIDQTAAYTWSGTTTISGATILNGTVTLNGTNSLVGTTTFTNSPSVTTAALTAGKLVSLNASAQLPAVNGSLLTGITNYQAVVASANLKASADTEKQITATSYAVFKGIQIYRRGTIRVKFDLQGNANGASVGKVYINGVAAGTERSTGATSTYQTYSEDFAVQPGDRIQVYCYTNVNYIPRNIKNFRLYWDYADGTDYVVTTD